MPESRGCLRILFVAANPLSTNRVDLEREVTEVERELEAVAHRDQIQLKVGIGATPDDLVRLVRKYRPNVLHFSGHASPRGIVMRSEAGGEREVSGDRLQRFLSGRGIALVVLNACYTERQGAAIRRVVDFVIGTSESLADEDATRFSKAFYRSLGNGHSLRDSLKDGTDAVEMHEGHDVYVAFGDLQHSLAGPAEGRATGSKLHVCRSRLASATTLLAMSLVTASVAYTLAIVPDLRSMAAVLGMAVPVLLAVTGVLPHTKLAGVESLDVVKRLLRSVSTSKLRLAGWMVTHLCLAAGALWFGPLSIYSDSVRCGAAVRIEHSNYLATPKVAECDTRIAVTGWNPLGRERYLESVRCIRHDADRTPAIVTPTELRCPEPVPAPAEITTGPSTTPPTTRPSTLPTAPPTTLPTSMPAVSPGLAPACVRAKKPASSATAHPSEHRHRLIAVVDGIEVTSAVSHAGRSIGFTPCTLVLRVTETLRLSHRPPPGALPPGSPAITYYGTITVGPTSGSVLRVELSPKGAMP